MKKYILLILLLFIASLNFNLIIKPLNLVVGGNQSIAVILSNLINVKPVFIILIINIIMFILSIIFLSKEEITSSIIATFIYPLFISLTSNININPNNIFIVILCGLISGLTCGYIYKLGFNQGGINTIFIILKKKFKIKIFLSSFILNIIILIISYFMFGLLNVFYSLIVISLNSYFINKVLKKKL